jgi:hypothetical protein
MSDIAPLFIGTDDHVMLGNRIRECREALMYLLRHSIAGSPHHREAKLAIAALDRLRSELDCHLQETTPRARDPRRLADRVYAGRERLVACLATPAERRRDSFAGWEMDEV